MAGGWLFRAPKWVHRRDDSPSRRLFKDTVHSKLGISTQVGAAAKRQKSLDMPPKQRMTEDQYVRRLASIYSAVLSMPGWAEACDLISSAMVLSDAQLIGLNNHSGQQFLSQVPAATRTRSAE